jgi:hypothetical protein
VKYTTALLWTYKENYKNIQHSPNSWFTRYEVGSDAVGDKKQSRYKKFINRRKVWWTVIHHKNRISFGCFVHILTIHKFPLKYYHQLHTSFSLAPIQNCINPVHISQCSTPTCILILFAHPYLCPPSGCTLWCFPTKILYVFWRWQPSGIAPCSLTEAEQHFRGAYCLHHLDDDSYGIALMMEAVCTSESSVYFETTWCYIPEVCHLHTHCHENLKSHLYVFCFPMHGIYTAHIRHLVLRTPSI